jgi:hypothetical protein
VEIIAGSELIGEGDHGARWKRRCRRGIDPEGVAQAQELIADETADAAERTSPAQLVAIVDAGTQQAGAVVDGERADACGGRHSGGNVEEGRRRDRIADGETRYDVAQDEELRLDAAPPFRFEPVTAAQAHSRAPIIGHGAFAVAEQNQGAGRRAGRARGDERREMVTLGRPEQVVGADPEAAGPCRCRIVRIDRESLWRILRRRRSRG